MSSCSRVWKRAAKRWRRRALFLQMRVAEEAEISLEERARASGMYTVLDECLMLIELLLKEQKNGQPMDEVNYQKALGTLDRINLRFSDLKSMWRF